MKHVERIAAILKEIDAFDYLRLKKQEEFQQAQVKLQQEIAEIREALLTRQGEIIGLKRLIAEEEKDEPLTP